MSLENVVQLTFILATLSLNSFGNGASNQQGIKIDGSWSPWSKIETICHEPGSPTTIVHCGGGVKARYRSCTMPTPQGGGKNCVGDDLKYVPCNTHTCQLPPGLLWSSWSECSNPCGRGHRKRYTMCGNVRSKYSDEDSNSNGPTTESPTTTLGPGNDNEPEVMPDIELEYEEKCKHNQYKEILEECNTWNLEMCPSPCDKVKCPSFAKCHDHSNETDPAYECVCQLGTIKKDDGTACVAPIPAPPTPRPIPTLPPPQKTAATVITRGASLILIGFLCATLALFALARIWDSSRVIHFNMEIALLCANLCLLPPGVHEAGSGGACRVLSIAIHLFFAAAFTFMLLESLHLYALVGWVVKRDGLMSRVQNTLVGWTVAVVIVLFNMCFEYKNYGGRYHCWLQMDTSLIYGQYVPIAFMTIVTLAIVEAAGAASDYQKLDDVDDRQRTSAKIMQRTLLIILPLVFTSFVLGSMAEYEQNIALYSTYTLINGILGGLIFVCHCSSNETIREKLMKFKNKLCPGKEKEGE